MYYSAEIIGFKHDFDLTHAMNSIIVLYGEIVDIQVKTGFLSTFSSGGLHTPCKANNNNTTTNAQLQYPAEKKYFSYLCTFVL